MCMLRHAQTLFDRNNLSIDGLKNMLRGAQPGASESSLELEQMRSLAERRQNEVNILRNQLEQKDVAMELLRNNTDAQVGGSGGRWGAALQRG